MVEKRPKEYRWKYKKWLTPRVEVKGHVNFLLFLPIFLKCSITNTLLLLKKQSSFKILLESSGISRRDKEHFHFVEQMYSWSEHNDSLVKRKSQVCSCSLVELWLVFFPKTSHLFLSEILMLPICSNPGPQMINNPIFKFPKLYLFTEIHLLILLTSNLLSDCSLHSTLKKDTVLTLQELTI